MQRRMGTHESKQCSCNLISTLFIVQLYILTANCHVLPSLLSPPEQEKRVPTLTDSRLFDH